MKKAKNKTQTLMAECLDVNPKHPALELLEDDMLDIYYGQDISLTTTELVCYLEEVGTLQSWLKNQQAKDRVAWRIRRSYRRHRKVVARVTRALLVRCFWVFSKKHQEIGSNVWTSNKQMLQRAWGYYVVIAELSPANIYSSLGCLGPWQKSAKKLSLGEPDFKVEQWIQEEPLPDQGTDPSLVDLFSWMADLERE